MNHSIIKPIVEFRNQKNQYKQCCSCHATQQDAGLPGRSNRQQSCWDSQHATQHETPVAYSWGHQSQLCVEIGAVYNGSCKKTTTALSIRDLYSVLF